MSRIIARPHGWVFQIPLRQWTSCGYVFNPRITVNGTEAHGSWNFLGPFTFRKGNRQLWLAARYEDDYVKINGQWKFKHLRAFGRMAAPYEKGWASGATDDVFANER